MGDDQGEGAGRQCQAEEFQELAPAGDDVTTRHVGLRPQRSLAFLVSRTVCHASSLEARSPAAHPATGGPTPAILAATLFAGVWSRFFRRGPLEYLLNAATKPVKYLR
ncbi:DUF418 domain-containing protein [Streptomyces sp. SLBN-31]|uniref:DUF418 domain-containing protein n=1 Tax=Streptomyces sp. SLBN-31 TaxID=2768444 RepID=UPI00114F2A9D|nr:DUF418 domain-containing protein [Streptomyces sp. SLBN-31]TQJ92523.1 hypothetical protein FBY22_3393 [Streptomyces sp. SLBN-31]